MADKPTCETCRFWLAFDPVAPEDDGSGACRRYPPTINPDLFRTRVASDAMADSYQFPVVDGGDWCGEHQPRPSAG